MVDQSKDDKQYQVVYGLAEIVERKLLRLIKKSLRRLGDPYIIRAAAPQSRVKSLESLQRKARKRRWNLSEALKEAQDLLGFRVVCNNLQDASHVADILKNELEDMVSEVKRIDYVQKRKDSGYRAVHLVFTYVIRLEKEESRIGCEIQIRTLLQHAWAELSRADIYASERIPSSIEERMRSLSDQLSKADVVADKLRQQLARPRKGRPGNPVDPLKPDSIAFVYNRHFAEELSEYSVQRLLNEFDDCGIRVDGLDSALSDRAFLERLGKAYCDVSGVQPDSAQILYWVMYSLAKGSTLAAVRKAESDAKSELRTLDLIGRSEFLASLPQTLETLLRDLEYPDDDDLVGYVHQWAAGFGTATSCHICGELLVYSESFADELIRHYRLRGRAADRYRKRIIDVVEHSGAELYRSWDSGLCSYCGQGSK